jgi:hypothetical protein
MAEIDVYPLSLITKLNTHLQHKLSQPCTTSERTNNPKLWTTFTLRSAMICKNHQLVREHKPENSILYKQHYPQYMKYT